jgi:hypothetical protein
MSPQQFEPSKLGGGFPAQIELGEHRDRLAVEDPAPVRRPISSVGEAGRPPSLPEIT